MTRRWVWGVALALVALAAAAPASATVFRSGNVIRVGPNEVIADDLVAAGQSVLVEGTVQGDVIATGTTIRVPGRVQGNVLALGQAIDIPGTVQGSVRAAGQNVNLSGRVDRNVSVAAQNATVARGAAVGRDLDVAGQSALMDGTVAGRASVAANTAQVGGQVAGNLRFNGRDLDLAPSARVGGDLITRSQEAVTIPAGAVVAGQVQRLPVRGGETDYRAAGVVPLARNLLIALALFATGAVGLALAPRFLRATAEALTERPGWSALWGFILLVVVPVAAILVIITVVGIPLGLIALALWGFAILLSAIPVGLWLGRKLFQVAWPRATALSPYESLALGLVLLALVWSIPILGGLVRFAVVLFGLGMFALAAYRLIAARPAAPFAPAAT